MDDSGRDEELRRVAAFAASVVAEATASNAVTTAEHLAKTTEVWKWLLGAIFAILLAVFGIAYRGIETRLTELEQGQGRTMAQYQVLSERLATVTANQTNTMQIVRDSAGKIDLLLERR